MTPEPIPERVIVETTGHSQPAAQVRWFQARGIRAELRLKPQRLRGAVFRGCTRDAKLSDPIGSLTTDEVYAWSVERWAKRAAFSVADAHK